MSHITELPQLSLVEAGPGDPDLITVKGAMTLAAANVVFYDSQVDPRLLAYARPSATKISVGPGSEQQNLNKEDLNVLVVRYTLTHGHVVRLLGGDPNLLPGNEALAYAADLGIQTSYIPGVSCKATVTASQELTFR